MTLRDYNSEVKELVTECKPVEVIFIPAMKIWLSSLQETFYFSSNLDSKVELATDVSTTLIG